MSASFVLDAMTVSRVVFQEHKQQDSEIQAEKIMKSDFQLSSVSRLCNMYCNRYRILVMSEVTVCVPKHTSMSDSSHSGSCV